MLAAFEKALEEITKHGPAGLQIPLDELGKIVANAPDDARLFVARRCRMAASQPGHLEIAAVVGRLFFEHFGDNSLLEQVVKKAKRLDAIDVLASVAIADDAAEPPQRARARDFWATRISTEPALCDQCGEVLARGDGYLESGRIDRKLGIDINFGDELVCERCFRLRRTGRL